MYIRFLKLITYQILFLQLSVRISLVYLTGIWAGMLSVRYFDGKTYEWVGISRQPNIMGKACFELLIWCLPWSFLNVFGFYFYPNTICTLMLPITGSLMLLFLVLGNKTFTLSSVLAMLWNFCLGFSETLVHILNCCILLARCSGQTNTRSIYTSTVG